MTSVATITNTRFGLLKRLEVGAKTTFLLRSRSLKFMISVAMKIAIKSKNGDYELHYEPIEIMKLAWLVEHITSVTVCDLYKKHFLGLY